MTEVLFVCEGNVARSQIAAGLANKIFGRLGVNATSAGTRAEKYRGRTISELCPPAVECMRLYGVDIADKMPRQVKENMFVRPNKVVVMAPLETWPGWFGGYAYKTDAWSVVDPKGERSVEIYTSIAEQIGGRLLKFGRTLLSE